MGGDEGCCKARCGGGGCPYDVSRINRIMLGFRPIAPKPPAGDPDSSGSPPVNKNVFVAYGEEKTKYVRVWKNKRYKRKKRITEKEGEDGLDKTVVTLQLLPENTDRKESPTGESWSNLVRTVTTKPVGDRSIWLNFNSITAPFCVSYDRTAVMRPTRLVESLVTVECVTDPCMDGGGLGSTDEEKMKNLEGDTCPGFISDGLNGVQWANEAYKRTVCHDDGRWPAEMKVRLVTKERLPFLCPAFACRVRLQYTWRDEKCSQMAPCDVWRMDCGGFVWRLDVKAALSLGPLGTSSDQQDREVPESGNTLNSS